jgi:hypothetical protein
MIKMILPKSKHISGQKPRNLTPALSEGEGERKTLSCAPSFKRGLGGVK